MQPVCLHIEVTFIAKVASKTEACTGNNACCGILFNLYAIISSVVSTAYSCNLQLCLRFNIPTIIVGKLSAPFTTDAAKVLMILALDNFLITGSYIKIITGATATQN